MAARNYQFRFRVVELFKGDTLGTGSYGGVCKAKCDGLLCAAKIMHPTLFDLRDPGTGSYLERFEEEGRLLGSVRHPNVVQYLGTYHDPETRLPVLLMELCDESLCRFLERSPGPVAYHIQHNIAHDIALALVYLHLNDIIHRDLTGNNVLLIAGARAKVTDFGMSRLTAMNPRTTPMTLCPGNICYMSPEALEKPTSYTAKLDVFSFGVILVQIMTRQFPDPGPRFKSISIPGHPEARVPAPETERRASHMKLIADTHPLKAIAIHCLKGKERERPTSQQLNDTLSEMKQTPEYTESLQQSQTSVGGDGEVDSLRRQIRYLQHEVSTHQEIRHVVDQKQRENEQLRIEHNGLSAQVQQLGQQLQGQRVLTEAKTGEILQVQSLLRQKERELQEKDRALQTSEQMVAQIRQRLEEKEKEIIDFKHTTSSSEGEIRQQEGVRLPASSAASLVGLRWETGKAAPQGMVRGSAVVDGNTIYINPRVTHRIYSCKVISSQEQQWSTLPDHEFREFSLVVIENKLTSVGGRQGPFGSHTNSLLSLIDSGGERGWSKVFPAMPTPRDTIAALTTQHILIVAGGHDGRKNLDIVEVMDIPTRQWSTVDSVTGRSQALCHTLPSVRVGGERRSLTVHVNTDREAVANSLHPPAK